MSKLIKVHEDTYEQLKELKKDDSFDEAICRLLQLLSIWNKFDAQLKNEKSNRYERTE